MYHVRLFDGRLHDSPVLRLNDSEVHRVQGDCYLPDSVVLRKPVEIINGQHESFARQLIVGDLPTKIYLVEETIFSLRRLQIFFKP